MCVRLKCEPVYAFFCCYHSVFFIFACCLIRFTIFYSLASPQRRDCLGGGLLELGQFDFQDVTLEGNRPILVVLVWQSDFYWLGVIVFLFFDEEFQNLAQDLAGSGGLCFARMGPCRLGNAWLASLSCICLNWLVCSFSHDFGFGAGFWLMLWDFVCKRLEVICFSID